MIGKNLPVGRGVLPFGGPRPFSLATGFAGLLLGTVGHLFLLLLPGLGPDVARIVDGVDLGVFRGRFLECDAHVGSKVILSLFRQQSPRESTRSCLENLFFGALWVFGHLLFEFDDAIEEGTVWGR